MDRFALESKKYLFWREEDPEVLLDLCDYFGNFSRLPLWDQGVGQIANLKDTLSLIHQWHLSLATIEEGELRYYDLLDVLVARALIKIPGTKPSRTVEVGAEKGIVSARVGMLLWMFHPDNTFLCLTDKLGNESGNVWVDRISGLSMPSRLRLLVSDLDETDLAADHFDVAIINGTAVFPDIPGMIKETDRITRPGGWIYCFVDQQQELREQFLGVYPGAREYEMGGQKEILSVHLGE